MSDDALHRLECAIRTAFADHPVAAIALSNFTRSASGVRDWRHGMGRWHLVPPIRRAHVGSDFVIELWTWTDGDSNRIELVPMRRRPDGGETRRPGIFVDGRIGLVILMDGLREIAQELE